MVDILGTLVAAPDDDRLVVRQVVLGHALHLAAHRGREHQRLMVGGQRLEDLVDGVRETHVEHLVGLVEDDAADLLQVDEAAVLQVEQTAGRGHDDVDALLQRTDLRLDGSAAVDGLHVDALHKLREVVQVVGNLQAELARGTEDKCLRGPLGGVEPLQHGDAEGGRLARARLRQGDDVALSLDQEGDD